MRTIIQKIGPLYGEAVNGSVFGQPNGSVYYPPVNTIFIQEDKTATVGYIKNGQTTVETCTSNGAIAAAFALGTTISFSGSYSIKIEVATSSDFSSVLTSAELAPYENSVSGVAVHTVGLNSELTVAAGTTYYVRALVVYEGATICTSDTLEFEGVV